MTAAHARGFARRIARAAASAALAALFLTATATSRAGERARTGAGAPPDEFWRMTGRVVSHDGAAYSYAANFFRYAEPNGVVLLPATVTIVQEAEHRVFTERRVERAGLGLSAAAAHGLDVRVGTWRLSERSTRGRPSFALHAALQGVEIRLTGAPRKPEVAFDTAVDHEAYTSISSRGTIVLGGRRVAVSGTSWLDRASSDDAPAPAFEAFRVQLDDGREIYVEARAGPRGALQRRAFLVERDGRVDVLPAGAYEFGGHPGSLWRSPRTGTAYADVWGLHVDGKTAYLSLEPVTYDQESSANGDGASFWDGAVDVYDVTPGSPGLRLGSGYVLMRGALAGSRGA